HRQLARFIAYIPQSHTPVFNYSVFDVVLMGTTPQLTAFASPGQAQAAFAECALETLGISHLRNRSFLKLSGGERQLALVARALAQQARVLIMDEPTANLDYGNQVVVQNRVRQLAREGYTVIQSTHNPDQAFLCADRMLALKGGTVLADGVPGDIITEELIRSLYGVDVRVSSLDGDRVRVCVPLDLERERKGQLKP
ncbi:MAG: ABC transporter ATP-binding protein, partial [Oscillospiraceae bacterium]